MIFSERKNANSEGLRALSDKVNKLEAERKSLYSMIDKLADCIDETNRRFSGLIEQVEALENRITDLELFEERINNADIPEIEEEELNETG